MNENALSRTVKGMVATGAVALLAGCVSMPAQQGGQAGGMNALQLQQALSGAKTPEELKARMAELKKQQAEKNKPQAHLKGYAKDFAFIRALVKAGYPDAALLVYENKPVKDEKIKALLGAEQPKLDPESDRLKLLYQTEHGTLALDNGELEKSLTSYKKAREILGIKESEGKVTSALKDVGSGVLTFVSGNEELQPYQMRGYESVLLLNYNALGYLLKGSDKAYNVSRMAIDWQNIQKDAFEKKMKEAEKEAKEKSKGKDEGILGQAEASFSQAYAQYDKKAGEVASAYVNPFGYYMSGVVMELDAYGDGSSLDDAYRAYKKALELNPKSQVIKKSVEATKKALDKGLNKNHKLVHVVVGEGFSPEVRVLMSKFALDKNNITLQMPILQPIDSKVAKVQIEDAKGKVLAPVVTVTDIEAIALRHQKDEAPLRTLRLIKQVFSSGLRDSVARQFGGLGEVLNKIYEKNVAKPDARSWLTLPRTLRAARLSLPKNIQAIYIVAYDAKGKRLSRKKVALNKGNQFVYSRIVDQHMWIQKPEKLWAQ